MKEKSEFLRMGRMTKKNSRKKTEVKEGKGGL